MSSTLKERLKRCGRYHASPKVMTPVAKQQEESHTNTAAKKLCTRETDEKSLLSTPNSKLNCDKNDIYSGCKTQSYLVNISKPLSELHPNSTPKTFKNISVLEPENHSLDVEKNCSEKLSAHCPQTSETQTAVGRTRMDMNRSLSHMGACKQSVNQSDVVSTLSTTPVSSRSMRRVNVKVNKLDFEKEKEGIVVNGPAHTTPSENSSETGRGVDSLCSDSLMMKHESESKNEVLLLTGNKSRSNDSGANNSFNERQCLLKEISEKEETIRKLRMVKMYRTKVSTIVKPLPEKPNHCHKSIQALFLSIKSNYFLTSQLKHTLWMPKRAVSMRQFF